MDRQVEPIYFYNLKQGSEALLVPSQMEGKNYRRVLTDPVINGNFAVYTDGRQIGPLVNALKLGNK